MKEVIIKLNDNHVKVKGGEYVQDLVRCKDCGHRDDDYVCYRWSSIDEWEHIKPDGFCSYGEVRDE